MKFRNFNPQYRRLNHYLHYSLGLLIMLYLLYYTGAQHLFLNSQGRYLNPTPLDSSTLQPFPHFNPRPWVLPPQTATVYNRASIKGLIYPCYKNITQLLLSGQYPT